MSVIVRVKGRDRDVSRHAFDLLESTHLNMCMLAVSAGVHRYIQYNSSLIFFSERCGAGELHASSKTPRQPCLHINLILFFSHHA